MAKTSASEFAIALESLRLPTKKQLKALRIHYGARKRTVTFNGLAKLMGYKRHGGINLLYGGLAGRLEEELDAPRQDPKLLLLVELGKTSTEHTMKMRPEFVNGLKQLGCLNGVRTPKR